MTYHEAHIRIYDHCTKLDIANNGHSCACCYTTAFAFSMYGFPRVDSNPFWRYVINEALNDLQHNRYASLWGGTIR